jgi:RimJ/RimL family protein N-acetyltransferase
MKAVEKLSFPLAHDVQPPPPVLGGREERSQEWRTALPTLTGARVTLRELQETDAASLFAAMSTADVTRFLSPPPTSLEGFERFIAWTHRQRAVGQYVVFGLTPRGSDAAVGVLQIRSLEPDFGTAEWGFALATEFWGTGLFMDAAQLAIDFAFDVIGTHRLEARAALKNGRGNGALRKLGAVQEGLLRRSFLRNGEHLDQVLWTILADEWREAKGGWRPGVIH